MAYRYMPYSGLDIRFDFGQITASCIAGQERTA